MENLYQIPSKPSSKSERNAFWTRVITDQIASGMDMTEFCRRHQLKFSMFRYWKYRSKIGKSICDKNGAGENESIAKFIPLQFTSKEVYVEQPQKETKEKADDRVTEIKIVLNGGHDLVITIRNRKNEFVLEY
jgi:hypothetical protein